MVWFCFLKIQLVEAGGDKRSKIGHELREGEGHLMQRVNSLEKTLMLEGIGGKRRRGRQRMRWLDVSLFFQEQTKLNTVLCQTFVFCYLWSLGGNLTENHWDSFDTFIRTQFDDNPDARVRAK